MVEFQELVGRISFPWISPHGRALVTLLRRDKQSFPSVSSQNNREENHKRSRILT